MQKQWIDTITKFGLSPTAAKTYLALVETGSASADRLAVLAGTYKANVYEALERLMDAGLATFVFEGKKKIFQPVDPSKLADVLDENHRKQIQRHNALRHDVEIMMPELSRQFNRLKEKERFEVYRGRQGYKTLISEIVRMESPEEWKGFGNLQVQEFFPIEFSKWFKKTKFRLFSTRSEKMTTRLQNARKTTDVKIQWLPEQLHMPIVWVVFGKNVLILIYEPETIAIRIQSSAVAETFSNQFEYLWKKHSAQ